MKRAITYLFFLVLLIDTYAIVTSNQPMRMIFKPLLMCVLAFLYWLNSKKPNFWFLSALFFSFWGDVLLLFKEYFVLGLVSFLIMHLLYVVIIYNFLKDKALSKIIKMTIPFLVYFGLMVSLMYSNLIVNHLLLPVMLYGLVISMFGTMSFVNYLQDKTNCNLYLFLGAVLFIISDSLIGINQFYKQSIIFEVLIMLLYGVSQYTIYRVMLKKLH